MTSEVYLVVKVHRMAMKIGRALHMAWLKIAPPGEPKAPGGKLLLHIGCGHVHRKYFYNIDARPMAHVHLVTEDLFSLEKFETNSADLVYMSHLFEHVKRQNQKEVLAEMYRVLKPGGILRLGVPDFDRLLEIYYDNDKNPDAIQQPLMGNQDYEYNMHYAIFTVESLTKLLKEAGFSEVREWEPDKVDFHDFEDRASMPHTYKGKVYYFSLNLEAVK